MTHREKDIFVEVEHDHETHFEVRQAPVEQKQSQLTRRVPFQIFEVVDREIGAIGGLFALVADNSDAHVRFLNHVHVVRAVADRQSYVILGSDHFDHVCFLIGRGSAENCAFKLQNKLFENFANFLGLLVFG